MTAETLLFFDGRPQALETYEALESWLVSQIPQLEIRVQKTQISFYDGYMFACASLPRRKQDSGLLVTFGLPAREEAERIVYASEPYPGRWTHHVPVQSAAEIDGELQNWLLAAWQFCKAKKKKQ